MTKSDPAPAPPPEDSASKTARDVAARDALRASTSFTIDAPAIPREGAPKGALCAACSTDHTGDELGEDCIVEFKGRERIFYCDDYCRGRYDERTSARSSLPGAPSDTLTDAAKDKERLDWLDSLGKVVIRLDPHDGLQFYRGFPPIIQRLWHEGRGGRNQSLREAIDAARITSGGEKQ